MCINTTKPICSNLEISIELNYDSVELEMRRNNQNNSAPNFRRHLAQNN